MVTTSTLPLCARQLALHRERSITLDFVLSTDWRSFELLACNSCSVKRFHGTSCREVDDTAVRWIQIVLVLGQVAMERDYFMNVSEERNLFLNFVLCLLSRNFFVSIGNEGG